MITVPNQSTIKSQPAGDNFHFLISLTEKKILNIPLHSGISFVFSAQFLTHRQHRNAYIYSNDDDVVFNVASYGNK